MDVLLTKKLVFIAVNLDNRAGINPNATKKYILEYFMPLDAFFSKSYRVSSVKMDLNLMDYNILTDESTYLFTSLCGEIHNFKLSSSRFSLPMRIIPWFCIFSIQMLLVQQIIIYIWNTRKVPFSLIARGLLFGAILFLVFSLYAMIRTKIKSRSDEDEMVREETIPESEMREFIAYYEELTAIRIDIKHLESDLSRKKIAKKTYTKQLKVLETKMKTTQDDIKPYKKLILNTGGPIADIVKRLDLREAELISNQDSIKLYDDRYKKGKLPSKQAYNTLRTQMIDNGEKIQRQIDRLINQMKTYLI